jgi:hypothetical protein
LALSHSKQSEKHERQGRRTRLRQFCAPLLKVEAGDKQCTSKFKHRSSCSPEVSNFVKHSLPSRSINPVGCLLFVLGRGTNSPFSPTVEAAAASALRAGWGFVLGNILGDVMGAGSTDHTFFTVTGRDD